LWPAETKAAVFSALHAVFSAWGLPIALYTDRARWAFYTPKAGGPVDRQHLTQVGRAISVACDCPLNHRHSSRSHLQELIKGCVHFCDIQEVDTAHYGKVILDLRNRDITVAIVYKESWLRGRIA
jgi:hypothetical protein